MEISLKEGQRLDEIGFGDLKLIQNPEEFCYGVDAVLLADFAASFEEGNRKRQAFDLGCGTGIIPIVINHKIKNSNIIGVEVQDNSYELIKKNIAINNLENFHVIKSNVKDISGEYYGSADYVTSNPPYMEGSSSLKNINEGKQIARHEILGNLDDFVCCAAKLLKDKGRFYMVHRPSRLVDIFQAGRKFRLEPKVVRFVAPKEGKEPNIVLIKFVKNGGKELRFLPTINVYGQDGDYSEEIKKIYER